MTITHAFSGALLHFVWQGIVVALLVRIVLYGLRKRSANVRYAVCCAALVMLTALPAITTWLLLEGGHPATAVRAVATVGLLPSAPAVVPGATPGAHWLGWIQMWAVPVWSIGVLFCSMRMVGGCTQITLLRRRGEVAGDRILSLVAALSERMGLSPGMARHTRVLISSLTTGPSVVGWLRPVILLPASAITGLSPQQLEAVLAHELAHIRRHDYLVNLLQMAAEALLFYHPAVWWVSARIRGEREFCCDDLAVRTCQDPVGYARALTALEKLRLTTPATALGSTGGSLLNRISRLLCLPEGAPGHEYGPTRLSTVVAFSIGLVCIGLNVGLMRGQPSTEDGFVTVTPKGIAIVSQTAIEYPAAAKAAHQQGNVTVKIEIDGTGKLTSASLVPVPTRANPAPPELQQVALESVRKWRFAEGDPAEALAPKDGNKYVIVSFQIPEPLTPVQKYLKEGDKLFLAGHADQALPWYEQGEQKFPEKKIDFQKRQIEVYIRQGNQTAAKAKMSDILKESPNDPETRGLRASYLLDEGGDKDDVINELTDVIRAKPENFVKEFSDAMTKLKKGEMTDTPVKSEHGWHIIKLEDVRPVQFPALADIKPQIKQHLEQQKLLAFRDEIRQKAKTDYKFSSN